MIFLYQGPEDHTLGIQPGVSYDCSITIQQAYFKGSMARPRMGVLICKKGAGKGKPYNSVEQMLKEWHPIY